MFKKRTAKRGVKRSIDKNEIIDEEVKNEPPSIIVGKEDSDDEVDLDVQNDSISVKAEENKEGTETNSLAFKAENLFRIDSSIEEKLSKQKEIRARIEASRKIQKKDSDGDKIYTGAISNKSKKDEIVKLNSSHIKDNYLTDYQRDVCKDFLKTGYCGFGDTCKFLHVRDEFSKVKSTSGEKDWEKAAKRRKKF